MKNFIMIEKDLLERGFKGNTLRLYLMMLDRAGLSYRNGFIDKESGEVYIIMTVKEICARLSVCKRTAASILGNLEAAHLIIRKKQGLGKPQRILVTYQAAHCDNNIQQSADDINNNPKSLCNFDKNYREYASDQNDSVCNMTDYDTTEQEFYMDWWDNFLQEDTDAEADLPSGAEPDEADSFSLPVKSADEETKTPAEEMSLEVPGRKKLHFRRCKKLHFQRCKKLHPNNTKYNNTKSNTSNIYNLSYQDDGNSYMTIRNTFLNNIDYDILAEGTVSVEIMNVMADVTAEVLAERKKYIHVAGGNRTYQDVYNRLMSIDSSHIEYILDCIKGSSVPVRNPRAYMLTCLYNAPATIDAYYELQAKIDANRQTAGIY